MNMSYINILNIAKEFINFLRNADILTISQRGVSTQTDTFNSTGGAEDFTLTKFKIKNVRSVTNNSVLLKFGIDYTLTYDSAYNILKVSVSKSLTETTSTVIVYDYGNTDKIFYDFERHDLTISSFPRIHFSINSFKSEIGGFGNVNKSSWNFQINMYSTSQISSLQYMDTIRQYIITNQTLLYYNSYIKPTNIIDLGIVSEDTSGNKIYLYALEVESKLNFEIN